MVVVVVEVMGVCGWVVRRSWCGVVWMYQAVDGCDDAATRGRQRAGELMS